MSFVAHYSFLCLSWPNELDRAAPAVHKVPENVRAKAIPGLNVGFLPTVLLCIFVAEVRTSTNVYTLIDIRKGTPRLVDCILN